MTEGILIREMMSDPLLKKYCAILVDEVHERSIDTDILLGLLKKVLRKRKDLKLIVASATVDAEELRDFFKDVNTNDDKKDKATILSVSGVCNVVRITLCNVGTKIIYLLFFYARLMCRSYFRNRCFLCERTCCKLRK